MSITSKFLELYLAILPSDSHLVNIRDMVRLLERDALAAGCVHRRESFLVLMKAKPCSRMVDFREDSRDGMVIIYLVPQVTGKR